MKLCDAVGAALWVLLWELLPLKVAQPLGVAERKMEKETRDEAELESVVETLCEGLGRGVEE